MVEWVPVSGSSMIVAEAYEPETERIYSISDFTMARNGGTQRAHHPYGRNSLHWANHGESISTAC